MGERFAARLDHLHNRAVAIEAIRRAPDGYTVEIAPETRTKAQNRLLWPLLADVSAQVDWHGMQLTADDWKDVFSASLKSELRAVPNINGSGFVALGQRTSNMSKARFSEMIELIFAFGAQRGVVWSKRSLNSFDEARA